MVRFSNVVAVLDVVAFPGLAVVVENVVDFLDDNAVAVAFALAVPRQ